MPHDILEPKIQPEIPDATCHEANRIYAAVKRACEFCIAITVAPAVLLTIALVSMAILWTIGRPILVKQDFIGKGGRVFSRLKLRTRMDGASEHASGDHLGRFLEDSCLAQLPELWNVLVGDMSIVGPRPESPRLAKMYSERLPNYELRQSVRPGITGYAQVYLRCANASTKLDYDLHYIRHMDTALDLIIVWHSLFPNTEGRRHD